MADDDDDDKVFDNDDLVVAGVATTFVSVAVDDKSIHSFALIFAALAAIDDNDDDVADIFDSLMGFSSIFYYFNNFLFLVCLSFFPGCSLLPTVSH